MTGGHRRPSRTTAPRLSLSGFAAGLGGLLLTLSLSVSVRAGEPIEGIASQYGPGHGVAMNFCTWQLRHSVGCGWVRIQSLQTGVVVVSEVVDYCLCEVPGSPTPHRLVDLQYGVRDALGLDPSQGLWPVTVERLSGDEFPASTPLPNTSTR